MIYFLESSHSLAFPPADLNVLACLRTDQSSYKDVVRRVRHGVEYQVSSEQAVSLISHHVCSTTTEALQPGESPIRRPVWINSVPASCGFVTLSALFCFFASHVPGIGPLVRIVRGSRFHLFSGLADAIAKYVFSAPL